ncbi:MAG: hypothetical protein ABI601_16280 [bacterium]
MTITHLVLRVVHISMGMIGLLSGAASMTLRKGSARHRQAGNVFFVSMLLMSGIGAGIATFVTPVRGNIMGGLVTFYLTLTAWLTVWRPPRVTGRLELGAALLGLATATAGILWGTLASSSATHRLDGYPPALYFIFGGAVAFATLLDVRMIVRGGFAGAQRTTRHLWRMCAAMFMATTSFFLGQAKLFPPAVRHSGVLNLPVLLVIAALLYWLVRIRLWPWLRGVRSARRRRGDSAGSASKTLTPFCLPLVHDVGDTPGSEPGL